MQCKKRNFITVIIDTKTGYDVAHVKAEVHGRGLQLRSETPPDSKKHEQLLKPTSAEHHDSAPAPVSADPGEKPGRLLVAQQRTVPEHHVGNRERRLRPGNAAVPPRGGAKVFEFVRGFPEERGDRAGRGEDGGADAGDVQDGVPDEVLVGQPGGLRRFRGTTLQVPAGAQCHGRQVLPQFHRPIRSLGRKRTPPWVLINVMILCYLYVYSAYTSNMINSLR